VSPPDRESRPTKGGSSIAPTTRSDTPKGTGCVNNLADVVTVSDVMTAAEEAPGSSVLTLLKATQPMVEHTEESYRLPGSSPLEVLQYLWQKGPHSLCANVGNGFEYVGHYDDPESLLDAAAEIDGDVYWGIHATPGAKYRGTNEDVTEMSVLHVELDWADDEGHKTSDLPAEDKVRSVVDAFPIRPTAVIESGGGLHLYWRLSEPADPDTFERGEDLLRAAFEAEGLDVDRTDAASVLRVPGC
jgi:hypothetical protein